MKYITYIVFVLLNSMPDQHLSNERNAAAELDWCEFRRLTWPDFKAQPDRHSFFSAVSATYIEEQHGCSEDGSFKYTVKAVFVKNESWSANIQSEDLLAHEQSHFDLTEYYARKLRKRFRDLKNPCQVPDETIRMMLDSLYNELESTHQLYDQYTLHGLKKENQAIWNDIIAKCLYELNDFACESETIRQR